MYLLAYSGEDAFQDGQIIGQVNGGNITISKKDGKIMINGKATVLGAVPASNGIVYVIDEVLLPPKTNQYKEHCCF